MKTLHFYGASDDLVEIDGPGGDEFNTDRGRFRLALPDGRGLLIEVAYTNDGVWSVGAAPAMDDPDDPEQRMPDHWRLTLFQGAGATIGVPAYSMGLRVECDDEAELTWENV